MVSLKFFGLLILALAPYWLIPRQGFRNIFLTLISCAYLYLLDSHAVIMVAFLSIFTYVMGRLIHSVKQKGFIHGISVILVLSVLVVFKYLGMLNGVLVSLAGFMAELPVFNIGKLLLPLGLSYIVFKHISYLTDIKWGLVQPGRFVDFLLYSSLFTIYTAGPIERFERLKPQLENPRISFSWDNVEHGFMRIVFGLVKKLIFADWIGYAINPVWQNPHQYGWAIGMLALIGYAFQIYFDFAGYSDMAIGASRLFGLRIMENFNNPYLAPNISQFWRRWHISLSDWIRDYLFFPLSQISGTKVWTVFFVPVIAMALCGLWHGAAWHYVIWGVWHGLGLAVYQIWGNHKRTHKAMAKAVKTPWFGYPAILMNFSFVTIGWYWFR